MTFNTFNFHPNVLYVFLFISCWLTVRSQDFTAVVTLHGCSSSNTKKQQWIYNSPSHDNNYCGFSGLHFKNRVCSVHFAICWQWQCHLSISLYHGLITFSFSYCKIKMNTKQNKLLNCWLVKEDVFIVDSQLRYWSK